MSYVDTLLTREGHATYTTTIYVDPKDSLTIPDAETTTLSEVMRIPADSGSRDERSQAINAFFADVTPPEMIFTSEVGETIEIRYYVGRSDNVRVFKGQYAGNDLNPVATIKDHTALAQISDAFTTILSKNSSSYTDSGNTSSCPVFLYQSKSMKVTLNAGEPKRVRLPSNARPELLVRGDGDKSTVNEGLIDCYKIWGQVVSTHFTSETKPLVTTGRTDFQEVFTTVGTIIEIVYRVASVVIPFLVSVARDEPIHPRLQALKRISLANDRVRHKSFSSGKAKGTRKVKRKRLSLVNKPLNKAHSSKVARK